MARIATAETLGAIADHQQGRGMVTTMSTKHEAAAVAPLHDDPVWRAAMAAPVDDTPDTEEERAAIEEVRRAGFHSVPGSTVSAEIARRSCSPQ